MTVEITPDALTSAILETREEFLAMPHIKSVRDIGNGSCVDFMRSVFGRLGLMSEYMHGGTENLKTVDTSDYWRDDFSADMRLLRKIGEPIPPDLPQCHLADVIGSATHEWVCLNGRHYDATAPEGRDHFLEIPFFADQIDGLRKELAAQNALVEKRPRKKPPISSPRPNNILAA